MSAKTYKTAGVILSNVVDGNFGAFELHTRIITYTLTHSCTVKLQSNDIRFF